MPSLSPSDPREYLQSVVADAYRIERELPAGGMSRLFLATETTLRRPVVIKLLPRELTSGSSTARFQREMQLAAQLQHPHILPILAASSYDGLLYYVMPYLPGESLRHRLARDRRLPVDEACRILAEVADALAYAHRSGVVHRDIKPENILLEQGHAIVTDFGIARVLAEAPASDRLTATGMSVGTPGYMAPEQAAGESRIDSRADVYSLGVVGYEMLAGEPPFTRHNVQALLAAHLAETPAPIASRRPEAPAPVCAAIDRALAKSPDDRFASAREFLDALGSGTRSALARSSEPRPIHSSRGGRLLERARRWLVGAARDHAATVDVDAASAARRTKTVSSCTIAVLPFAVRGSDRLAYLGDGLVDLLSMRLDGAGGYGVADPRAVLGIAEQSGRKQLDPERARAIAERLGAGRFVLGTLLEIGGRLQLTASLYDQRGDVMASAQVSADEEAQIFELVDELAIQLLAGDEDRETAGVIRLATATTHSLPALRAYLEGEHQFRRGQYTLAEESFRRAVDNDPMFALAWYRLSMAAEWSGHRELQDEAAEQALHRSGRLSEHDRRLLEAFVAWRRGHRGAEALYRDIVAVYPNDIEAWFQLGEVLFHYGPLSGRSFAESREPWERVLAYEPRHLAALHHLARIAALEGRRAELEELTNRIISLSPEGERAVEMAALRAFALGDESEQARVIGQLRGASDMTLIITIRTVATNGGHVPGALRLALLATERSRAPAVRALGHVHVAYLEAARGRWEAARRAIGEAEPLDRALALSARGLLSQLPFLDPPRAELDAIHDELQRWDAADEADREHQSIFVRIHNGAYAQVREYLLGLLRVRFGDSDAAERHAAALEAMPSSRLQRTLSRLLAANVRAELTLVEHGVEAALGAIAAADLEMAYAPAMASPFYSGARGRFLRAELLRATGRLEDAFRTYGSFAENSVYDLIYEAPSLMRHAEIYDRIGRRADAERMRARAADLWRECDTSLRPVVSGEIPLRSWPGL